MKAIDCVSVERIEHSGAIRMTALCYDATGSFYKHRTFYGYTDADNETLATEFLDGLICFGWSVSGYYNDKGDK
jgi:hypothetical protein